MGTPTYLFDSYKEMDQELVTKVRQIATGLRALNGLIAHGNLVAPSATHDVKTYIQFVQRQINAATGMIQSLEKSNQHENIALQIDIFHDTLSGVLKELGAMTRMPSLDAEAQALNTHLAAYDAFEEDLKPTLSREDLVAALKDARDLLKDVNGTLISAQNNLLVKIATCSVQAAAILAEGQAPVSRPKLK